MDKVEKIKKVHDKLWNDYLELCESYQDEVDAQTFGFLIIQFASKMLYDTAPSYELAKKTIDLAIQPTNKG